MDVKKHEEGWVFDTHPSYSPIFILTQGQKEGFCHQLHTESEAVGKGVALGDAMHLVHAILEFFKRFLLLLCKCAVQFLTVPGNQLQELLQPFVTTSALLEGHTFPYHSSLMMSIFLYLLLAHNNTTKESISPDLFRKKFFFAKLNLCFLRCKY